MRFTSTLVRYNKLNYTMIIDLDINYHLRYSDLLADLNPPNYRITLNEGLRCLGL